MALSVPLRTYSLTSLTPTVFCGKDIIMSKKIRYYIDNGIARKYGILGRPFKHAGDGVTKGIPLLFLGVVLCVFGFEVFIEEGVHDQFR